MTLERERATSNLPNAISFFVMNHLMINVKKIHPALVLNADATQFAVGGTVDKVTVKYYKDELSSRKSRSLKVGSKRGTENNLVKFFIKFYLIINCTGSQSNPVYLIADANLADDECQVYEVPLLGIGTNVKDNVGYVVFCKDRIANSKFYDWVNEHVLIPFASDLKTAFARDIERRSCSGDAWFQLDGESTQLDVFQHPNILDMMRENNFVIGKPPGSTTAITQPCDAGNCFRGPKTSLKRINDMDVDYNVAMLERLQIMFAEHNKYLNSEAQGDRRVFKAPKELKSGKKSKPPEIKINPNHVKMASKGLLRIQYALQKSLNQKTIRDSFKAVGIDQFSVSLDNVLKQWNVNSTKEIKQKVNEHLKYLTDKMDLQGELFENDLAHCGFREPEPADIKRPFASYVLNRRRSCIVTNENLQAREKAKNADPTAPPTSRKRSREFFERVTLTIID
jgi:hypothetical protein